MRHPALLAPIAALPLLLAGAVVPAPALAGEYPMHQCRAPDGATASLAGIYDSTPDTKLRDGCQDGAWLTLIPRLRPTRPSEVNSIGATLPASAPNVRVARLGLRFNSGRVEDAEGHPRVQLHAGGTLVWEAPARPGYAISELVRELPGDVRRLTLSSVCYGPAECRFPHADELNVFAMAFTLEEPALPDVAATGGSMARGGSVAGEGTVDWEAADQDSGVRSVRLLVDGTPAGGWRATCRFDRVRPCAGGAAGSFAVDTTRLAEGPHTLRLEAEDAAGNLRLRELTGVEVDNVRDREPEPARPAPGPESGPGGPGPAPGAPGGTGSAPGALLTSPNGVGATATATLRATFEGTSRTLRRVRYGSRALVTGRLLRPGGRPIAGARLDVSERGRAPGAAFAVSGQVSTGQDGSFSLLAPAGPSRLIRFGYRATLEDVAVARTVEVDLRVLAGVTLRPSRRAVRNGRAVVFSGRLAGGPHAVRQPVELQASTRGRWLTFATTRARRGGAFRRSYRFTRTSRRQTYRFRARIRPAATFDYEAARSKVTRVRVRP